MLLIIAEITVGILRSVFPEEVEKTGKRGGRNSK
jgi:hypothetical protein